MQNRRALLGLLSANFISGLAQGMSMISIPMHFAAQGQSDFFGLSYALMTLVTLFWAPYAGTLVDRYDRRRIFLLLNLSMGLLLLGIALGYAQTGNAFFALAAFALTFWNYNLHYPSFYGFLQEVISRERYSNIAATIEIQGQFASALAGAGAGFLLQQGSFLGFTWQAWTLDQIFLLDASTYFISLIIIYFIRYTPQTERKIDLGSVGQRMRSGLGYLRSEPGIFLFGCLSYAVFVTIMVHCLNLSPAYAQLHLHDKTSFAISEFFYAIGAILAGFSIQKLFRQMPTVKAIVWLHGLALLAYLSLGFSQSVLLYYLLSIALGLANAGVRILRVSYLMGLIPTQFWGRATSIFGIANTLGRMAFLGLFSLPFFHSEGGILYTYYILSSFLLLVGSFIWWKRAQLKPREA